MHAQNILKSTIILCVRWWQLKKSMFSLYPLRNKLQMSSPRPYTHHLHLCSKLQLCDLPLSLRAHDLFKSKSVTVFSCCLYRFRHVNLVDLVTVDLVISSSLDISTSCTNPYVLHILHMHVILKTSIQVSFQVFQYDSFVIASAS